MKKSEFLKGWIKPATFRPIQLEDKQISFIEINERKNTVRCVNRNNHDSEPFTVRTNSPLHEGQCAGYFEVRIVNMTSQKNVTVGFCRKDCSMKRPPGTSRWSVGLTPNGVVSYDKQRLGVAFKFGKDDTVGCGIVYDTLEVFFTKNGVHEPKTMFKLQDAFGEFYPNASLHCESEELQFNFGERPFRFDFEGLLQRIRSQRMQSIIDTDKVEIGSMYKLVEEYLYFSGYSETLKKFKSIVGGRQQNGDYLLTDTGKDVLGLDAEEDGPIELIIQEEHKSENEDDKDIVGEVDEIKTPVARRQRIMSQVCLLDNLQLLSSRKDSYDERVMKLIGRKDSVLSGDIDFSVRMEVEEDQNVVEKADKPQLLGSLTRHFLQNQRIEILRLIKEMKIQDALQLITREIPKLLQHSPCILYYMYGHIYLRLIKQGRIYDAIDFARQKKLDTYKQESFPKYCPERGQTSRIKFDEMISTIAVRKNFERSLLSREQFHALAELINCQIIRALGLFDKSKLELMLTHIRCVEERYDKERLNGDRIQLFN